MVRKSGRHRSPWLNLLLVALAFSPLLITLVVLWRTQVPIPHMDDYDAILLFANRYVLLPTTSAKIWYVVDATHVQYKLILLHALVAADLELTGRIHLAFLQWWGDLSLLLIAACLWTSLPAESLRKRLLLFLPVALLVAMLRDYEALGWALGCLQQLGSLGYVMLALLLFVDGRRSRFLWGCIAYALALWSSLNGILLLPIGLLLTLQQRRLRRSAVLLVVSGLLAFTYLHGYAPAHAAYPSHPASVIIVPLFFFAVLGDLVSRVWAAVAFGMMLVLATVPLMLRTWRSRRLDAVAAAALFLLLNAGMITAGRFRFGMDAALPSRYSIYSQVFAAIVYSDFVRRHWSESHNRKQSRAALPTFWWALTAVCLLLFTYYEYRGARFSRDRQLSSRAHLSAWTHYGPAMSLVAVDDPRVQCDLRFWMPRASATLARSAELGIYIPPVEDPPPLPPEAYAIATACSRAPIHH